MPILPMALLLLIAAALTWTGWYFLFRTVAVVEMNRRALEEGGRWAWLPYAGFVEKRWFPLVIRLQGILSWVGALLLFGLAASQLWLR